MTNKNVERKSVDALLKQRVQASSEMPWIELRVMSQVEWREQAKSWLKSHPGGLDHKPAQPLRLRLWSAVCALATARSWPVVGVALAVACLVYLMTRMTVFAPAIQSIAKWGGVTMLGAVLVVLAVAVANWPRLRHFYS